MNRRFLFFLFFAGAVLSLCIPPAPCQSLDDCLTCHQDRELKTEAGKSLFVDREKFLDSAHGRAEISCVDCHADLKEVGDFPHEPKLSPVDCGRCHPGAGRRFAEGQIHFTAVKGGPAKYRSSHVVKQIYTIVIAVIIGVMLVFIGADFLRRLLDRTRLNNPPLIRDDEVFLRMNLAERIQHWILIGTFFLLIITGLPLFFYEFKFFRWFLPTGRSFYIRGIIHRLAAALMILNFVWHLLYAAFTKRGRDNFKEMIPRVKDIRDAIQAFGYNTGFTRFLRRLGLFKKFFARHPFWLFENPPLYGRYNFVEKFEYWAMASGSFVMIFTGFFMWNVKLSLRLFPLWVHEIFIIIHGYEAILAFLAVIIWHMYNVHLNPAVFPMSKVWLNGKITGKELRLLHPLEYEKIQEERRKILSPNAS